MTDFNLHAVFRISVENDDLKCCSRVIGELDLCRPSGIQVDLAGNLLVTDSRHNALKIFRPDGTLLQSITRIGPDVKLDLPLDVTVSAAGFIALLDLNGRVSVF